MGTPGRHTRRRSASNPGISPSMKCWRATFYTTGMEHSLTSAPGTGWERTPWRAVQVAGWQALRHASAEEEGSGKDGLVAETLGAEVEECAFHETKKPGERHADTTSIHGCCVMRHLRSGLGVHGHRSGGPSRTAPSDGQRYAKDLVAVGWSGGGL